MSKHEEAVARMMEAIRNIGHDGDGREFNILCVVEGLIEHVPTKILNETAKSVEEDNEMQDDDDWGDWDEE